MGEVDWLWQDRIPYGMLSEICGDPGQGKSWLTLALARAVAAGKALPGDLVSKTDRRPGKVLMICTEDSPEVTIRPRLEAMGADVSRIGLILGGMIDPGSGRKEFFKLSKVDHREWLAEVVQEEEIRMVVIDPITAHLGGANEWKDSDVRSVLAPLSGLAHKTGTAIVMVRHLSKQEDRKAIYRAGGSIAFTASVRSSLLVGTPKMEPELRGVVRLKGNLAPEPHAIGFGLEGGSFSWEGVRGWTVEDMSGAAHNLGDAMREAVSFLSETVPTYPDFIWKSQLEFMMKEAGITKRTMERAKLFLGIDHERDGAVPGSPTKWFFPSEESEEVSSE